MIRTPQNLYELFRLKEETTEKASAQGTVYESYQIINNKTQLRMYSAAAAASTAFTVYNTMDLYNTIQYRI
jgi:hypothetical protein